MTINEFFWVFWVPQFFIVFPIMLYFFHVIDGQVTVKEFLACITLSILPGVNLVFLWQAAPYSITNKVESFLNKKMF